MAKSSDPAANLTPNQEPGWERYLNKVARNQKLNRLPANDYQEQIREYLDSDDKTVRELLQDEISNTSNSEQLLYDFGRSLTNVALQRGMNPENIRPDSLALKAALDSSGDRIVFPDPRYALKGMTDVMENEDYMDVEEELNL